MTPYLFAFMAVVFLFVLCLSIRVICNRPRCWKESSFEFCVVDTVFSFVSVLFLMAVVVLFALLAYFEWRHQ